MEVMKDSHTIQGYGIDVLAKNISLASDTPMLSRDSIVGESSIAVNRYQWIELGSHRDTCLGNISLCDNGFTFATFFKIKGNHTRGRGDYHTLFVNAVYRFEWTGIWLAVHSLDSNSLYFQWRAWWGTREWGGGNPISGLNDPHDWHHVAITWNKSNTTLKLYFNGQLRNDHSTARTVRSGISRDNFNVSIGGYPGKYSRDTTHYMVGNLDDIYIWNSAQTEKTIRYLSQQRPTEDRILCQCSP